MPPPFPRIFCSSSSWRSSAAVCSWRSATSCSTSGPHLFELGVRLVGGEVPHGRNPMLSARGDRRRTASAPRGSHPPHPLGRLRRADRAPQLRGALLGRRWQRPGHVSSGDLLVLDLRGRNDPLRGLARNRPADRQRALRPARAAGATSLGHGIRARRRGRLLDLRLGSRDLGSAAAGEPRQGAGHHERAVGARARRRVRREPRPLRGDRAVRRGADLSRGRPVAARLPRALVVDHPGGRRVRTGPRTGRGAARARPVRYRARLAARPHRQRGAGDVRARRSSTPRR